MRVLGLTGGIGSGKSTVANILKSKNLKVIDADIVAREVVEDELVINKLTIEFGNHILDERGTLNRKLLGKIVFDNSEKLKALNNILHPIIKENIKEKIKRLSLSERVCILDAAILIEAGFKDLVDEIILVDTKFDIQIARVKKRDGYDDEFIKKIISNQMSLEEKKKHSNYIINNDGDLTDLEEKTHRLINKVLNMEA